MVAIRRTFRVSSNRIFMVLAVCVLAFTCSGQSSWPGCPALSGTICCAAAWYHAETGPVTAMALSPDRRSLILSSHSGMEIRELHDNMKSVQKAFEADQISDLEFSPDGTMLVVSGGTPGQFGVTEILKWPSCERYALHRDFDEVCTAVAWSPDCCHIAVGLLWTTTDNKSGAGTVLISSSLDQSIRLFVPDVTEKGMTITQTRVLEQHTREVQGISLADGASRFQNEKLTLVSWGDDRTLRFWQPLTGRMLRFARLDNEVIDAAWDPEGKFVMAALSNGEVVAVELQNANIQRVKQFDQPITRLIASNETGQFIASDFRGRVHYVASPKTMTED